MSNLSTKERNKLPDSAFCYVRGSGDTKVRLFPILDAADVTSAAHLIGKSPDPEATKRCIVAKAKANGWKIPDAWKDDRSRNARGGWGELAAAVFAADEVVIKRGKVFEAGDYPDKGVDFTPEDLLAAVVDFTPIPINAGHPLNESPLDGLMGELRSIELAEDGVTLMGEAAIPKWLDDLLPEGGAPVSLEWSRSTKKPLACSIVTNPRIDGAQLVAAFAKRHDTDQGQAVLQSIHDRAALGGAVCKQDNVAKMASAHEARAMQAIHDMAIEHGATCNQKGSGGLTMGPPYYSGDVQSPRQGRSIMAGIGDVIRWLRSAPEGVDADAIFSAGASPAPAVGMASTAQPPSAAVAHDAEKDALKAELARERAKGIQRDAAAFADRMIEVKNKAFPAERDSIVNAYIQAAQDDTHYGVVTFASGATGSRVGLLEAAYEARPEHQLTMEQLRPEIKGLLFNKTETETERKDRPLSREELDSMLALTPLGSSVLKERQHGKA